jgi:hypothetical protein
VISTPTAPPTAAGVPISGATTASTGKPFLGEEIGAGVLALAGLLAATRWRRQRRIAG